MKSTTIVKTFLLFLVIPSAIFMASYVNSLVKRPDRVCSRFSPTCLEFYFEHHWSFRKNVIRLSSLLNRVVFNEKNIGNVYIANNNWLFYSSKTDGDILGDYTGKKVPERTIDAWSNYLERQLTSASPYLKNQSQYFVVIAPNKSHVYQEYLEDLPFRSKKSAPYRDLFATIAERDFKNKIVTPEQYINSLRKEKYTYYIKGDSHWNVLGAAQAYNLLANTHHLKKIDFSQFKPYNRELVGDLYNMLNFTSSFLTPKDEFVDYQTIPKTIPENKKILIIGDSFRTYFVQALRILFTEVDEIDVKKLPGALKRLKNKSYDQIFEVHAERNLRNTPPKME